MLFDNLGFRSRPVLKFLIMVSCLAEGFGIGIFLSMPTMLGKCERLWGEGRFIWRDW